MTFHTGGFLRSIFFAPNPFHGNQDKSWKSGDIAECIAGGTWYSATTGTFHTDGPKIGDRIKVQHVEICDVPMPRLFLKFKAFQGHNYAATCFRKVVPVADELRAADADFIDLLRTQPAQLPPVPVRELEEAAARWSA